MDSRDLSSLAWLSFRHTQDLVPALHPAASGSKPDLEWPRAGQEPGHASGSQDKMLCDRRAGHKAPCRALTALTQSSVPGPSSPITQPGVLGAAGWAGDPWSVRTGCWGHCQAGAGIHGHHPVPGTSLPAWRAISAWKNTSAMLSAPGWLIPAASNAAQIEIRQRWHRSIHSQLPTSSKT